MSFYHFSGKALICSPHEPYLEMRSDLNCFGLGPIPSNTEMCGICRLQPMIMNNVIMLSLAGLHCLLSKLLELLTGDHLQGMTLRYYY